MNSQLYSELNDLFTAVSGDIVDFRVYKGVTFSYLVKLGQTHGKFVVGLDTFNGLSEPSALDRTVRGQAFYPKGYAKSDLNSVKQNVNRVCKNVSDSDFVIETGDVAVLEKNHQSRKYAYALLDLLHYYPTKHALEYLLNKMEVGGVIHCLSYSKGYSILASKAIDDFLTEYGAYFRISEVEKKRGSTPVSKLVLTFTGGDELEEVLSSKAEKDKRTRSANRFRGENSTHPTIAMVLRTGGDTYNFQYVNAVAQNIKNNLTIKHNITVLTDNDIGIDSSLVDTVIPLKHSFPGWWSKIELFRPDIFKSKRAFFVDLDTVIVGNIDDMVEYETDFAGIQDLYGHKSLQTGIMSWNPNYNHQIYEKFLKVAPTVMERYRQPSCGDARWVRENVDNHEYLQKKFPNRIISYKAHCLDKYSGRISIPDGASIICFHGKPRPHTIVNPLITKHWKYGN